jgi:hypothetical protein
MDAAIERELTRFVEATGDARPLAQSNPSLDRRAKIACYRGIVRELREKSSREHRRMTWLERQTVRDLLGDIARLERDEEAFRVHEGEGPATAR